MSYIHNNEVLSLPSTRDDLTITFRTNRYLNTLKACERNLSKLNIPFDELYSTNYSSHSINNSLNIIINPVLFQTIKNHISNIEQFVEYNLLEQKSKLSNKIINNLIKCEQETKTDLHLSLLNNKNLLCALHSITTDIEHLLKTFTTVTTKNKQLISDNAELIHCLSKENQRQITIKNNIAYYKVNIRKIKLLYDQLQLKVNSNPSTLNDVLTQFDSGKYKRKRNVYHNYITQCQTEQDTTMSYYNTNTKSNTYYGSNVLTSYGNVSRRSEEDEFRNKSERMKQTARALYKKTLLLNCEKRKFVEKETKGDKTELNGVIFNKVISYIDKAKKRLTNINDAFCKIYKNERMFDSERKIVNDEGFRKLFIEMLVKDEDVQRIVDKNLIMNVTQTRKVLNMKHNSGDNTIKEEH